LRYTITVTGGLDFDWDDENRKHLAAHRVSSTEFEEVMNNEPMDLACEIADHEERYRSVGLTNGGRVLTVAWAARDGNIRAITAFPAGVTDRKLFLEKLR